MRTLAKIMVCFLSIVFAFQSMSCATIPEAIEYRNFYTNYKMSDTIFLDVMKKQKYRNIFIDVRNTSQFQEVDTEALKNAIAERLAEKGYNILSSLSGADYILQVNILYFDYFRKTAAKEAAAKGTIADGVAGGAVRGDDTTALILAALGAGQVIWEVHLLVLQLN